MARPRRCDGCHAELATKEDLRKEQGTTRRRWTCRYCGTSIPSVVAERLQHERH